MKVCLCRFFWPFGHFDESLMPECGQGFVKVTCYFSRGGLSMLLEPSAKAVEGPLCRNIVVECCGFVASHFLPSLFMVFLGNLSLYF